MGVYGKSRIVRTETGILYGDVERVINTSSYSDNSITDEKGLNLV